MMAHFDKEKSPEYVLVDAEAKKHWRQYASKNPDKFVKRSSSREASANASMNLSPTVSPNTSQAATPHGPYQLFVSLTCALLNRESQRSQVQLCE